MGEIWNEIARELLCPLTKTLAVDPVLCEDGFVYEREALELLRSKSNPFSVPLIAKCPFHSKLKFIIEKLVSSGEVNQEYLAQWTEKRQTSIESAIIVRVKGAKEGDTRCMLELAEMYLNGDVVERDEKKAYGYFEQASEKDNEIGTARKADCLLTGTGVDKDFKEGQKTLIEAARMERSVHATLRLMYFHKEGLFGFEQDESATTKWASYMRQILPQTVDEHMLEEKMSALKKSLKNLTNPSWHGEDEPENVENEIDSDSFEETESEEPIAHEGPQMDAKSTSSDSEKRQVKKCVACKTLKPQTEFTASQWKKNIDTIRCSACVSKLPAYQAPQLRQKPCRSCGLSKAFEGFSLNQWRKKQGEGRCSDCVKKGTLDHIPFSSLRPINVFQT